MLRTFGDAIELAETGIGNLARGATSYEYETGPDGARYAVAGEVSMDLSPVAGDPSATLAKMQIVQRAALHHKVCVQHRPPVRLGALLSRPARQMRRIPMHEHRVSTLMSRSRPLVRKMRSPMRAQRRDDW